MRHKTQNERLMSMFFLTFSYMVQYYCFSKCIGYLFMLPNIVSGRPQLYTQSELTEMLKNGLSLLNVFPGVNYMTNEIIVFPYFVLDSSN